MATSTGKSRAGTRGTIPPLTKDSIKQGIKDLEEGKSRTFKSSKEFFKYLESLPDED
jgi:hypothetical protein